MRRVSEREISPSFKPWAITLHFIALRRTSWAVNKSKAERFIFLLLRRTVISRLADENSKLRETISLCNWVAFNCALRCLLKLCSAAAPHNERFSHQTNNAPSSSSNSDVKLQQKRSLMCFLFCFSSFSIEKMTWDECSCRRRRLFPAGELAAAVAACLGGFMSYVTSAENWIINIQRNYAEAGREAVGIVWKLHRVWY